MSEQFDISVLRCAATVSVTLYLYCKHSLNTCRRQYTCIHVGIQTSILLMLMLRSVVNRGDASWNAAQPLPVCSWLTHTYCMWNSGSSLPSSVQPARCPQRANCPAGCGRTWTAIRAFDLTWKELIDFCVTGSFRWKKRGKKKRCLLVISQHVEKYLRERGREGMKREITSHPTTSLLNYNNLTHMGWPSWQGEGRGDAVWGRRGDPCSGRSLMFPLAGEWKDRFDVRLCLECSPGAC